MLVSGVEKTDLVIHIYTWRKKWQLTPILLPGESHGQRSLMGYSPWGHKELDTAEGLMYICIFV